MSNDGVSGAAPDDAGKGACGRAGADAVLARERRNHTMRVRHITKWNCHPDVEKLREIRRGESSRRDLDYFLAHGLAWHRNGMGTPRLTAAGTGFVIASDLGLYFFDVCVLSKVYGMLYKMNQNGRVVSYIHRTTLDACFDDWGAAPRARKKRITNALARLRDRGLLPRTSYGRVGCVLVSLEGIREALLDLAQWVDEAGEEIRQGASRRRG